MFESLKPLILQTDRSGEKLIFTADVVRFLVSHQQTQAGDPESGGLLFAKIENNRILVDEASGPTASDRRGRLFFWPSQTKQQKSIISWFRKNRHYIGEWHTHPEPRPTPSNLDISSMEEVFIKAIHQLEGVVMVIVGTLPPPSGFWVGVHRKGEFVELSSTE